VLLPLLEQAKRKRESETKETRANDLIAPPQLEFLLY